MRKRNNTLRPLFNKKIANIIFIVLFIFLNTLCLNTQCFAQQPHYSPEFQALSNQVQQMYFAPKGTSIQQIAQPYSIELYRIFGHALRQQMMYIKNNVTLQHRYDNLVKETQIYLQNLTHRPYLWQFAQRAIAGEYDNEIWNMYRIRTGTAPSVLIGTAGPGMSRDSQNIPFQRDSANNQNQIDLLGNKPSNNIEAAKAEFNSGVDYWNAGTGYWRKGDRETAQRYYQIARDKFQRSCKMGLVDGCRPGAESGETMTKWQ